MSLSPMSQVEFKKVPCRPAALLILGVKGHICVWYSLEKTSTGVQTNIDYQSSDLKVLSVTVLNSLTRGLRGRWIGRGDL